MKVLVTCAVGFIGSALLLRLLERGNEVIVLDNRSNYYFGGERSASHSSGVTSQL